MTHHASDVRLGVGSTSQWIPERDIYFAFPTGSLMYDCVTCGAKCCRGFGYSTPPGPGLDRLLEERPILRVFLERTGDLPSARYNTSNCAPGCFFLTSSGLCDIHSKYGSAAKPETCRLFPFNNFRLVGRYLVVAPHVALCPLQVCPPDAHSELSSHELLIEEMRSQGVTSSIPHCSSIWGEPEEALGLERDILNLVTTAPQTDFPAFIAAQLVLTDLYVSGKRDRSFERDDQRMVDVRRFLASCCRLLGITEADAGLPDEELARTLIVLTPALRAMLVLRDNTQEGASFDRLIGVTRIPFYLLGTFVLASCAKRAGMLAITYQSMCQMFQSFQPLLRVLACIDQRVQWRRDAVVAFPAFETPDLRVGAIRLARALLPSQQARSHATLGDLLCRHLPVDEVERIVVLKQMASTMVHQLESLNAGGERGRSRLRDSVGASMQHLVLRAVNEVVILASYERILVPQSVRGGKEHRKAKPQVVRKPSDRGM